MTCAMPTEAAPPPTPCPTPHRCSTQLAAEAEALAAREARCSELESRLEALQEQCLTQYLTLKAVHAEMQERCARLPMPTVQSACMSTAAYVLNTVGVGRRGVKRT